MLSFSIPYKSNLFQLKESEIIAFKQDLERIYNEEKVSISKDKFIDIVFNRINYYLEFANKINDIDYLEKEGVLFLAKALLLEYQSMIWKEDEQSRVMEVIGKLNTYCKVEWSYEVAIRLMKLNLSPEAKQKYEKTYSQVKKVSNVVFECVRQARYEFDNAINREEAKLASPVEVTNKDISANKERANPSQFFTELAPAYLETSTDSNQQQPKSISSSERPVLKN